MGKLRDRMNEAIKIVLYKVCKIHLPFIFPTLNLVFIYNSGFTADRFTISAETRLKVKYKDSIPDHLSIMNEAEQMIENAKKWWQWFQMKPNLRP